MATEKFANEVTKYDGVTVEQWSELKALLLKTFRLPIQQNQAKVQWGSTVYEWDTGVFEWDFHQNDNPSGKDEDRTYYLEIRIKRRLADPAELAVEKKIAKFFRDCQDEAYFKKHPEKRPQTEKK